MTSDGSKSVEVTNGSFLGIGHGDTAYCAQGRAGYLEVTFGAL